MSLITLFKRFFNFKKSIKFEDIKKKELTDKQLALLKSQYKQINDYTSKLATKKRDEDKKNCEEKNRQA